MLISRSVQEFLDETASNSPAPGGGSISAFSAALGAALTSMVCRLTIGKKKYADVQAEMEVILGKSEELRRQLTAIIDEDTLAFNKVMQAFGLPKETEEQKKVRNAAIQEATKKASEVPLELMQLCARSIELARSVVKHGNRNSLSDAGVSVLLLQAAARGAVLNVRINLASIEDEEFCRNAKATVSTLTASIDTIASDINSYLLTAL